MDIKSTLDHIKDVVIFSHLSESSLSLLQAEMEVIDLRDGEVLFKKGDIGDAMYIIVSGVMVVFDEDYEFSKLYSKRFFGEYALIDHLDRSASVKSEGTSTLLRLKQEGFERALSQSPEIKDDILKALILQLRQRNEWEEELAQKNKQITEQKEEIEAQRDEIQAQNDLKNRFFSIISHDLRGPVSSFQSIASLIKMYVNKGRFDEIEQLMEEVDQTSSSLSRLLDNLLNWARAEQDQMPYKPEKHKVTAMVEALFEDFAATARIKNITLSHDVAPEDEFKVDYNSTSTLLRNLIHNALKFTPEEGRISVSTQRYDGMVQINVMDSGVGMDDDQAKQLFGRGGASTYGTSGEKGVGLGLQLVKEFVALNKGEINVRSEIGQGTTFEVRLPS